MSHGNGAVTTLYPEMSGGTGTGTQHGKSGETLQALPPSAAGTQSNHARGSPSLPSLQGTGLASQNPHARGSPTLPLLTGVGYCGITGSPSLPLLTGTGSGTNTLVANGAVLLPTLRGTGTALTGFIANGAVTLRPLTGKGYSGARGAVLLPALQGSGAGRYESHAFGAVQVPKLRGAGIGHLSVNVARGAVILPKLTAGRTVRVGVLLPRLLGSGTAHNGAAVTTRTWAYNTGKNAVTEFDNYAFVSFVRFKNRHYGVGRDGHMYLLGGDSDNGVPIPWSFETGLDDLGSRAQKGVTAVYLDGIIERGADVTIVTDTGARYVYRSHTPHTSPDHRQYRVGTGKGIRTCSLGIGLSSDIGGYVEVDKIAPKYVISKRSI